MVKLFRGEICTPCLYFIDFPFTFQLISTCTPLLPSELLYPAIFILFNQLDTVEKDFFLEILSTSHCLRLFFLWFLFLSLISYLEYSPLAISFSNPSSWFHFKQQTANKTESAHCFQLKSQICAFSGQLDIFAWMSRKHLEAPSKVIFHYSLLLPLNMQLDTRSCRFCLSRISALVLSAAAIIISTGCLYGPSFL